MTTEDTKPRPDGHAAEPLALRLNDQLGPAVPDNVLKRLHAYGDSRADYDGRSGLRIAEAILALRRWAAELQEKERQLAMADIASASLKTEEHYELMSSFEREHKHRRLDREKKKENWKRGNVYEDGHVNELFLAYRKGYALGTVSGDAANRLAAAPVAIMDTREALGLCAPTEEDFPALYALQGRRVALVDLGPNVRAEPPP